MGRNIPIVSFLCGVIFRRRPPEVEDPEDKPPETPTTSSGSRLSPEFAETKRSSPEAQAQAQAEAQALPLPPGNGNFHMRTVSCGHSMPHHHHRSNSGVSKLVSSMSLRVMGGGGASISGGFGSFGSSSGREERPRHRERTAFKYFNREDSVWKKTIILGERCRVPDDDDDINLFDEKGNKITTYHPKTYSGLLQQYPKQNTHHEE